MRRRFSHPTGFAGFSLLLLVLAFIRPASANEYFTLDGYKIGQSIAMARQQLGKPVQEHQFEDGWKIYSFKRPGYYVHFETMPSNPDAIASIQIEGLTNPPHRGLDGVNLGDSAKAALKQLGKPVQTKDAEDLSTGEKVESTQIHFYQGYSFEEHEGKVSSIKVIYEKPKKALPVPDYHRFFQALENKDYYQLAELISSSVQKDGKPLVTTPMVDALEEGALHDALYDKHDNPRVKEKAVSDMAMRFEAGKGAGHVARFKQGPIHELVFYPTFEGMVLTEIR
jgi:hypothetical protein